MKHSTREKLKRIFDGRDVSPTDRIWALSLAGVTQKDIAVALDIRLASVNEVIHNVGKSYNVASKVAEVTGLSLNVLWPCGRYSDSPKDKPSSGMNKAA